MVLLDLTNAYIHIIISYMIHFCNLIFELSTITMAAATTANGTKLSLKLMVHKEKKRVIFAEADANFVEFLFSFMTMPLGTIIRLLEQKFPDEKVKALGSVTNLYQSLLDLHETYFSSKSMLLSPRSSS